MWGQLDTNKQVGGLFPNDADGNAWGDPNVGIGPGLAAAGGFTVVDPGRYENLQSDFTAQINAFKAANAEIVTGVVIPPDFTTFWTQANQQGYKPKAVTVAKAILFPSSVEALGPLGHNLSLRSLVDAEPSVQVVARRLGRHRCRRRLHRGLGPSVDPAGRLHLLAVRGRDRRAQARRQRPIRMRCSRRSSRPTSTRSPAR